jgi:hypothetical protein
MKKKGKKVRSLFCCHLIQDVVTLTITNLEKTDMALIYGEARGH